jgi:outer membrane receptor for ferric coprogen and ferric-rhodotorulic acid
MRANTESARALSSLKLNASNLFDKKFALCTDPVATCNYGQARTVLATLRYRW